MAFPFRFKQLSGTVAFMLALSVGASIASEPIEGVWKLPNGILIESAERNGEYCGTVISGEFSGRSIGCVKAGINGRYRGQVVKVKDGKRFRGYATVVGDELTVTGCVLFILCKSEKLRRQEPTVASK